MSRRRSRLAALALALGLAAAVIAIATSSRGLRARERAGDVRRGGAVLVAEVSAADKLEIEAGVARATFVRAGGGWVPEGPAREVQASHVPALLAALDGLRRRGTSGAGHARTELAAYGLDRPRARVAAEVGGRRVELEIGLTTGPDGVTFLRADRAVVIVAASDGEALARAAELVLGAPIPQPASGRELPLPPPVARPSPGG